jgi:hypothetical protein
LQREKRHFEVIPNWPRKFLLILESIQVAVREVNQICGRGSVAPNLGAPDAAHNTG